MGAEARVLVVGEPGPLDLADRAAERVADLEARWSRFLPDSEVSRLNASPGVPVVVSPDTFALVERAVDAWGVTAGLFDPTVLAALEAAGYDRSFDRYAPREPRPSTGPAPGCAGLHLDPIVGSVALPRGVRLDPGGIGKGLAADLVATELVSAGAAGALVDLGGDVRVTGRAPDPAGWVVAVEDPFAPERDLARAALADGAVATSSRLLRVWAGGRAHHLVDPRTGLPSTSDLVAVSVVAGEAWWAEVLAKAALLAGSAGAAGVIDAGGATGLLVDAAGRRFDVGGLEEVTV